MIGVSCLCPTYGRFHLLEEAVESFLRQDYLGESELIVVNDLKYQTILFSHPNVKVINLDSRFKTLGEKRNFIANQASKELLLTWGDDDIHLPHRISRMVKNLGEDPFCLEGWHYCSYGKELLLNRFPTIGAHIVRRDFYVEVGGVPEKDTGEDAGLNEKVERKFGRIKHATLNPAFWYRWSGTNRPHISAYHDSTGVRNPYQIVKERTERLIGEGIEPSGVLTIKPKWNSDYCADSTKAILK